MEKEKGEKNAKPLHSLLLFCFGNNILFAIPFWGGRSGGAETTWQFMPHLEAYSKEMENTIKLHSPSFSHKQHTMDMSGVGSSSIN